MPQQTGAIEELNSDKVVKQKFTAKEETVDTIDLLVERKLRPYSAYN